MDQAVEQASEKISQLPHEVRPGVWFEIFTGENNSVRRLKLSIIIMEEAQLVFVDRLGIKVLTKDAEEFAAELADHGSHIIAANSVFDHALSHVINSLAASS